MANKYYDLVEQVSTTTGTAGYVMSSTPAGRRPFSVVTNGGKVPYAAVDDAGGFEFGIGTWNSGTSTLARTLVLSSSNSNNAVSWGAGERRVYITSFSTLSSILGVRHSIGETSSSPDNNDDETEGYGIGSEWVTTSGDVYFCIDSSDGAAVWGKALVSDRGKVLAERTYIEQRYFDGSTEYDKAPARGIAYDGGGVEAPIHHSSLSWFTANDTPVPLTDANGDPIDLATNFGSGMVFAFEALVVATDATNRKVWKISTGGAMVSGAITLGTPVITELYESAGATAWEATVSSSGTELQLMAKGDATNYTFWNADYTLVIMIDPGF